MESSPPLEPLRKHPLRPLLAIGIAGCFAASCGADPDQSGGNPASEPSDPTHESRMEMIEKLRGPEYRIRDERVLQAMTEVPRHELVPKTETHRAYRDSPLPIGHGQTISQPYIVALMTEKLEPQPDETVLEIGTGSGYQAAVLAKLVKRVYTIEIVEELAERAKEDLARLGFDNVVVRAGDGYAGWPEHAPFDAIIVTCAPTRIPQPLVDQLAEGGRMVIPVGSEFGVQELYLLEKVEGRVERKEIIPVRFVPMTGKVQDRNPPE